jgi:predicted DNA-binding protein
VKPLKKKVSITLDEDIIEKVKLLAEDQDRSFSQYVNLVLKEYIRQMETESQ